MGQEFMAPGVHFEKLLSLLPPAETKLYRSLAHIRPEPAFRGRNFVLYEIVNREPLIRDNVKVLDFICNDKAGASCELRSEKTGRTLTVGYSPVQLWEHPVFMHLPLHGKLRWSASEDTPLSGSLAFDIAIRTQTRLHLRERGVTYCETGVQYAKEFEGLTR